MLTDDMKDIVKVLHAYVAAKQPMSLGAMETMAARIEQWVTTLEETTVFTPNKVLPFKPRVISNGRND